MLKDQLKRRPLPHFAGDHDIAAVLADDAVSDRKPQPHSFVPRGEERIEDLLADVFGYPLAGIGNLDHHPLVFEIAPESQRAPSVHRLNGVLDKINEYFLNFPGIAFNYGNIPQLF